MIGQLIVKMKEIKVNHTKVYAYVKFSIVPLVAFFFVLAKVDDFSWFISSEYLAWYGLPVTLLLGLAGYSGVPDPFILFLGSLTLYVFLLELLYRFGWVKTSCMLSYLITYMPVLFFILIIMFDA